MEDRNTGFSLYFSDRYVYVETGSKNHSGGLNDRSSSKVVQIYANPSSGIQEHVFLLDTYLSKIPEAARQLDIFYLRPDSNASADCQRMTFWYTKQPLGEILSKR